MTASDLTRSVTDWLALLDADQRAATAFPFGDPERFVWAFTPGDREGLALRDMNPAQRNAAMAMLGAALSGRGASEAAAVIALETVLGAIERDAGRGNGPRRDPALYWFAVFGDPSSADGAPWMWRIGGHHVAIHMTVADGRVVASSPSFLGANPAIIPSGPRKGERTLTGEEIFARELIAGLPDDVRAVAIVDPVAPPEILTSNAARADEFEDETFDMDIMIDTIDGDNDTVNMAIDIALTGYLGEEKFMQLIKGIKTVTRFEEEHQNKATLVKYIKEHIESIT